MRITEQCNEYGEFHTSLLEKHDLGNKKRIVLEYMKNRAFVIAASSANVFDFVVNSKDHNYCRIDYSDKKYEWTSNDILYIEKYNMKIIDEFIAHILEVNHE